MEHIEREHHIGCEHIDFINRVCRSDAVEIALHNFLCGNCEISSLMKSILVRHGIISSGGKPGIHFQDGMKSFGLLLKEHLNYKYILRESYNDLFSSQKSFYALMKFWDYSDPNNTAWIRYMSTLTKFDSPHLVELFCEYLIGNVIDVGGNNGTLASVMKKKRSDLDITVWDLHHVVKSGMKMYDNIKFIGGNFKKDDCPKGMNTAVVKSVLHDHNDEVVVRLLLKLRKAVDRIIICEVMGELNDIPWEQPYFSYLIPFSDVAHIRDPQWYVKAAERMHMNVVWSFHIDKSKYQIIVIDTNIKLI